MSKTKEGVIRTGREALMCKTSASSTESNSISNKKQTPLMNRVYATRMQLMHKAVQCSLSTFSSLESYQLLILGAGLDTSYDQYGNEKCNIFLVDFPEVAKLRSENVNSPFIKVIAADITNLGVLLNLLVVNNVNFDITTIIIFECVLCYIDELKSNSLLSFLASKLVSSVVISYDPIVKPSNSAGNSFSEHIRDKFSSRGAPLLSSSSTMSSRIHHFMSAGWKFVSCMNLNHASKCWLSPSKRMPLTSESFDEFTSLATIHNHYGIAVASNRNDLYSSIMKRLSSSTVDIDTHDDRVLKLLARITAAECQLSSLETTMKNRSTIELCSESKVKIRIATASDIDCVISLYKQVFEIMGDKYVSVRKFIKSNVKVLQNLERNFSIADGSVFYVAEVDDQIVGCVGGRRRDCRLELSHLCVTEAQQHRGIGQQLVSNVVHQCKTDGGSVVELTVLDDLIAARSLYSKLGFVHNRQEDLGNGCLLHYMTLAVV